MKKKMNYLLILLTSIFMVGCTDVEGTSVTDTETSAQEVATIETGTPEATTVGTTSETEEAITAVVEKSAIEEIVVEETTTEPTTDLFAGYELIEVDGGDLSGHREPNVAVEIGYGDREYWAFTNEYGQLVRVVTKSLYRMIIANRSYRPADTIPMRQKFRVSKVTF